MAPKGKMKVTKKADVALETASDPTPNWPAFTPLVPADHLYMETFLSDQILIIRNLFTSKLCKDYVTFLSSLPLTTTPGKPKRGEATRVNDRFQVEDPAFAQRLWEKTPLKHLVETYEDQSVWKGEVLGLNPNIRIYRYRPGQFFDQHYDVSNRLALGPGRTPARTTWTLLIYLSVCDGGETAFYPEPAKKGDSTPDPILVGMEVGMALLHNHDDCMLHEGKEVRAGEKWVLRSDLVVKR
jgi:2OG-Fe(II) oxygenase superfamily